MDIHYPLKVYSSEAVYCFSIHAGKNKRPLVQAALHKIRCLYKQAKKQHVYPMLWLLEIKMMLNQCQDDIETLNLSLRDAIQRKVGDVTYSKPPPRLQTMCRMTNALLLDVIKVIEAFDDCCGLIEASQALGAFQRQQDARLLKVKQRKVLHQCLTRIIHYKGRGLKHLSIAHYVEQTPAYQRLSTRYGKIQPQALYNALHMSVMPELPTAALRQIEEKLRHLSA